MQKRWLTILFMLVTIAGFSQQNLSLSDAIKAMKENNTQLKIQDKEIDLATSELKSTQQGFLPNVEASFTGFYTNDPLNAFGFKLQQKSVTQNDFNPVLLNDPEDMGHFNTQFSIKQPILNFDVFSARKAVKNKIEAVEFQKLYAEAKLEAEIKKAYTNLQFLYEVKGTLETGIAAYNETLRNTENFEAQGYAKKADVLMVKVGLADVQKRAIEVENNIANVSDYLTWLMGKEEFQLYKPMDSLVQNITLQVAKTVPENRSDILAMSKGIEAQKNMLKMNRRSFIPRINGFGQFNLYDKEFIGFGSNSYLAGIALSWNVFDGNITRNKIKSSKISLSKSQIEKQLYLEQNNLELQKNLRELEVNQANIDLNEISSMQAEESLQIVENRYAQGLEKTSDVLIHQATKLEKKVQLLEAIKDYNLSIIQIEFLTKK